MEEASAASYNMTGIIGCTVPESVNPASVILVLQIRRYFGTPISKYELSRIGRIYNKIFRAILGNSSNVVPLARISKRSF